MSTTTDRSQSPSAPIAIVGIGCRFADADDLHAFWRMTLDGRDAFKPVPADRWDAEAFFDPNPRARDKSYCPTGAWIEDVRSFPAVALAIPPRRVEVMDPQQRLALECALQAIEDAGRRVEELPHRTGVYMGVTAVEYRTLMGSRVVAQMMASGNLGAAPEDAEALGRAVDRVLSSRPFSAPGVLANMIAATVAQELRVHGPAFTTDAACASALVALASAVTALRAGQIDAALAGGVYVCLTPEHHVAFSRIGAISKQGRCLPFDKRADGFVQGDGCGVVMLKRLDDARRDGDRIYGLIHGVAMNNDGGGAGPMAPVKEGQVEVIRAAWDDAGLTSARGLGYVETHGTGTLVGDHIEFDGLVAALSERGVERAALGSTKANFGHTMSAAGICGLIRATLALYHRTIPPMAGFEAKKDDLVLDGSGFFIPTSAAPWEGAGAGGEAAGATRLATVSSFGFGGTNVHAVLGAAPDAPAREADATPHLVLLSGPSEGKLRALAGHTAQSLEGDRHATVAGVARAWAVRRKQPVRLAVVARTVAELKDKLLDFSRGGLPKGVAFGTAKEVAPRVAFLFPGQGAQRVGMLAGIRDRFPVVREALDALDRSSASVMERPVTHYLYPERRADAPAPEAAAVELTETHNTQPALFAVGYALARLLASVGVRPHVTLGHSVGEFTAAAVAGLTTPEDGLAWCARRGQGMQAAVRGDKGAMAALVADRATAEAHLAPGAVVANVNHPRQVVISGATEAVQASVARARAAGIEATELRVSHAFHSPIFRTLDLAAVVDAIPMTDAACPVASCIADATYADPATARDVYKRHATSPVLWTDAMKRARDAGADLFLQVAAGGPLLSFVRGAMPDMPVVSLASKEDQDGGASLLEGLGQLWVAGVDVDVAAVTDAAPLASVPPAVLSREVYWIVQDQATDAAGLGGGIKARGAKPTTAPATPAAIAETKPEPKAEGDGALLDIVIAAAAKASAYPKGAIRPSMRLGDDLGFDSMMVADFAEELRKHIPGFTGIPQELLVASPTIQTILDYVASPAATAGGAVKVDDDAPLGRFRPVWVPAPRPAFGARALPRSGRVLVVGAGAEPIAAELVRRGWARVDLESGGAADLVLAGLAPNLPPVSAVLAGEAAVPDPAAPLLAALDAQARAGATPDLIVALRASDRPWGEALAGVARAVAREWPASVVKVLSDATPADALAELTSFDRTVDVAFEGGARQVLGVERLPDVAPWAPQPGEVVLVTGGTRGIGKKLADQLAAAGARPVLVGRSAPVDQAHAWVKADVTDRAALATGLEAQGLAGKVTTIVHAAGLLADGAIGTVPADAGRAARAVKVDGLLHTIAAAGPSVERVLVIGSWAGRFGNRNQAHYGAANALAAELVGYLPARIAGAVAEFGPWTDSDMVRTIPELVRQAMRAEGVDFVGDGAGLAALREELGQAGVSVRGRSLPPTTQRADRVFTLATESHPYMKDHAIGGVPVLPLASAATLMAEAAQVQAPFEVRDLRLFQGITAAEPVRVHVLASGAKAEVRQGEGDVPSYRAFVKGLSEVPAAPAPLTGGEPGPLALATFYGGVTFHGPLLQGITAIDGVGPGFVRGRVKTSRPSDWVRLTDQAAWAIDPLAFDSAMQLAAYVAWVRYRRAGTPVGFDRFVQLRPWPEGEIVAEATFAEAESDKLSANLVFRTLGGEPIAFADNVTADMKKVAEASPAQVEPPATKADAPAARAAAPADDKPFEVKPEWVDVSKWRAYKDLAMRLQAVEAMGLKNPYFDLHEGTAKNTSQIAGREVINFSSYNYLGLSGDPRVLDEVEAAMRKYGTSVSASRVASGERPFHRELEAALAAAHGCEDALVMAGGHATNVNTIGHLFGPKDLILHDELIHDSCLQGIKLSGAARRGFRHEDLGHLEQQLVELRRHYEKVLILVEGVYSMDGDIANVPGYVRLKRKYGCMLMVDEAHSFGTVGKRGCGVGEHWGMDEVGGELGRKDVDIWMGTMSKSLASMGGWVAGRKELILYLRYTTPGFVFAAGVPPTLGQAALSALRYQLAEPWRVERLQKNCKRFYELLKERGLDTGPAVGDSPVIPVVTGDSMWALKLSEKLLDQGINAKPIIFPAVANDAARLRFFMTSLHTEEQLVYTADTIAKTLAAIREADPKKTPKKAQPKGP